MKGLLKKQTTRKTIFGGLTVFGFTLIAFFVLFLVNELSGIRNNAADWYLLVLLLAVGIIQWGTLLFVFNRNSSEDGSSLRMRPGLWAVVFLPTVILAAVLIALYVALGDTVDFFGLSGRNFVFALLLMIFVVGLLCAATLLLQQLLPARDTKEVVMRVVGKNDPEASSALGSLAYTGVGPADVNIPGSPSETGGPRDVVFPDLVAMDESYRAQPYTAEAEDDISLEQLCSGFNRYLESKSMFYSIDTIRAFVSGLASSRLLILEGISGLGKTSLPRYFAEYTGSNVSFTSVQSSWRDRSDVLGYYNDFSGTFKETPFLRALYRANYEEDKINLLVLDEMNLSRVEYYFADFLSVLELDRDLWKIELMPVSTGGTLPEKLEKCSIRIPENVWFVGTANKDESTYAMTDKVYDRAIVIDFVHRQEELGRGGEVAPVHIGEAGLTRLFDAAAGRGVGFGRAEAEKFGKFTDFMYNTFDVTLGNRLMQQLAKFVPVYVACGGTAEKALDLLVSRKVLRRLEGRFGEDLRENLEKLEKLVLGLYGRKDFSETLEVITKLKRKAY